MQTWQKLHTQIRYLCFSRDSNKSTSLLVVIKLATSCGPSVVDKPVSDHCFISSATWWAGQAGLGVGAQVRAVGNSRVQEWHLRDVPCHPWSQSMEGRTLDVADEGLGKQVSV